MSDESKLDELFLSYRDACPEVEPGVNFMPDLWRKIESRHSFGSVFSGIARASMAACAALCLLLVFLNVASSTQVPNYPDMLAAEHTAENTYFTEAVH